MNALALAKELNLKVLVEGEGQYRDITGGIYCGDLLSLVMGRAKADCAWITMMANVNAVAVAVLADTGCVILSEGVQLDEAAIAKAKAQGVCILWSEEPTFELAMKAAKALEL